MGKFLPILFDWLLKDVIMPFIQMLTDNAKMKSIEIEDQKIIEDVKNAKSDTDINDSLDRLP